MEKIVGMKIFRKREGKKIVECPRKLTFYNSEGKEVLDIHISEHTKEMTIHPHGAKITIFESRSAEVLLYKKEAHDVKWVTTDNLFEDPVFDITGDISTLEENL